MATQLDAKTRALRLLSSLAAAALVSSTTEASAFCRKTTCKVEEGNCAIDARGCVVTGAPIRWRKVPLEFRFSAERPGQLVREEARAAIRSAFHRWSDTLCGPDQRRTSLRFVEGEDISVDKPLVANKKAESPYGVFFRDRGWPYEGKADATLAQTNTFFGRESGLVEYSDIEINTGTKRFSTKEEEAGIDLQAVLTHEVGHYIGLDHSTEPDSIMATSYCEASDRCEKGKVAARRLSQDDIDAVCTLYPPDGYPTTSESNGCSAASTRETISPLWVLLGVLAVRRRRPSVL